MKKAKRNDKLAADAGAWLKDGELSASALRNISVRTGIRGGGIKSNDTFGGIRAPGIRFK